MAERTGKTRHRVVRTGFLEKKTYLVLQHQLRDLHTYSCGGVVDSEWVSWWEDSKPEWLLETTDPLIT